MVLVLLSKEFDAFVDFNVLLATDVRGLEFVIRHELNGIDFVLNVHCILGETFAVSKCSAATETPFTFVMFMEGELPEIPVLDPIQDVFVPDNSEFPQ